MIDFPFTSTPSFSMVTSAANRLAVFDQKRRRPCVEARRFRMLV